MEGRKPLTDPLFLLLILGVVAAGLYGLWPHLTTRFAPARLTYAPYLQSVPQDKVSLNEASLAELESLPGIGPELARRIVEHRPYQRVEDLLKVPGIGPKTLERLRPLVRP